MTKRAGRKRKKKEEESNDVDVRRFSGIEIRPTRDVELTPPPMATHFWVTGGTDALVVEFFYLDQETIARLQTRGEVEEDMEVLDDYVRIRRVPIARVALPLGVSIDVVSRLFSFSVQGIPGLTNHLIGIGKHMMDTAALANELVPAAMAPQEESE